MRANEKAVKVTFLMVAASISLFMIFLALTTCANESTTIAQISPTGDVWIYGQCGWSQNCEFSTTLSGPQQGICFHHKAQGHHWGGWSRVDPPEGSEQELEEACLPTP